MTEIGNRQALDLEALKELADKASAGPWYAGGGWVYSLPVYDDDKRLSNVLGMEYCDPERQRDEGKRAQRNIDFIAAARSAVPALVAEVERLRGISAALFEELAVKDQAIEDIRALADQLNGEADLIARGNLGARPLWEYIRRDAARRIERVLADLSARLDQDKGDSDE